VEVGIVGAGIAGLATAVAFARTGAAVTVFERPGTTPAGAGISLFGNGLHALDAIGLGHAVRALGPAPDVPTGLRRPTGRWLMRTTATAGPEFAIVHRVVLRDILAAAAPPVQPSTVAEVRTTADGATVALDSGAIRTFDLVVGADGIGSGIRRSWPDDPGIRYAGYTAWRGVTRDPVEVPVAGETFGRGERFGIAPLSDGRVYWYATVSAPADWSVPDEKAELLRRFATWHDPIPTLLDATDDRAVLRNDILALAAPVPRFTRRRVVLAGDAAHAMTPDLGQGGNQALEDAVTLAAFVSTEPDLDTALGLYDETRRRRTAAIARQSWWMGRVAQARNPVTTRLRNALFRVTPAAVTVRAAARLQEWHAPDLGRA
jgi:2-polyprenyl-6-methoxyphenol hydroxylase-like FAD-dependent oxidoreductase